jgi:hypothetical protein
LPEAVENKRQLFLADAGTSVGNHQQQFAFDACDRDFNAPTGRRKLDCIKQQIEQNPFQFIAISDDRANAGVDHYFNLEGAILGGVFHCIGNTVNEAMDVHRL